ncbi:uncharacterized protein SETTUDRAFT_45886 [Exserohilum turcica Et28A]|uniref:C3H1-type domain-containing protein n=1 Tax=Exserohilum turcicum (strain 28A) TaxID=671987 RepID=R0K9W3_EXST2|nr:uncharacterized protein SETTUDRAFT_45886 [Exserohilum turcica Et28A]EOA89773.1 hypothetical protein SETTUDRAFT_45886 [Exserohilum turcica Et28A]
MGVCSYYQRGACKFGDSCKNEHPGSSRDANRGGGFGGSNNNRFGAFNGDRYRPGQNSGSNAFGGSRDSKPPSFHLDRDDMKNDLTTQRPIYPLSCYGPGREAPRQLIEGPVEISPDELRLRYYTLRAAGNEPQAQQEEAALNEKMQQQVKAILDDVAGAIRYVEEGANIHPNRIDIAKGNVNASESTNTTTASSVSASASTANPFMKAASANPFQAASAQTSAFGQTSTPGFGKPAFGQPSNPAQTTSAFGQRWRIWTKEESGVFAAGVKASSERKLQANGRDALANQREQSVFPPSSAMDWAAVKSESLARTASSVSPSLPVGADVWLLSRPGWIEASCMPVGNPREAAMMGSTEACFARLDGRGRCLP